MPVRIRGRILQPGSAVEDGVLIAGDDGLIEAVEYSGVGRVDLDASGCWIAPGFIDVHVHGGGGADFMDGTVEAARRAAETHARFGTTTLLATTLTADRTEIGLAIDAARAVMATPGEHEARIAGLHLEGPYICAAKRGAQPLAPIRLPDWDEMREWIDRSAGSIRLMTMAPELEGAEEFIRKATAAGVVISCGHTNATYEQAQSGIVAGMRHGTHLFNAMPPLNHRSPGAVAALLEAEGVAVELIADGVHLHPAVVRLALKAKGDERVVLITDAISGAAMPDGIYALGGMPVVVDRGKASFEDGTLAGSVLTMNRAFRNIQLFAGASPLAAARMAATNAARQLGIDSWTGSLEVGKRADLVVIRPETGDVEATMRDGKWIYRR